jgi:putative component of toxin-antitoxin plasmid stabilization module
VKNRARNQNRVDRSSFGSLGDSKPLITTLKEIYEAALRFWQLYEHRIVS